MADDRPVESPEEALGRLQRDFEDFRSTMLARLARRPTGDVEPTIRSTPKTNTLLLNGQTVSRTTYAGLYAWAQEQGLIVAGLFTNGNGSTTFGLPNFSGRVPIGVGTLGTDVYSLGQLVGAAWRTLSIDNMPPHNHGSTGNHAPHPEFGIPLAAGGGATAWSGDSLTLGNHTHSTQGGGDPFDNRPASIAINWLIYT